MPPLLVPRILLGVSLVASACGEAVDPKPGVDDAGPNGDATGGADANTDACPGADLATDPDHCGECTITCAVVPHAPLACAAGTCTRGPCETGRFDLDGELGNGCEARCNGTTCVRDDGTQVVFTSPPLPETGLVMAGVSAGAAYGASAMSSSTLQLQGVAGEPFAGALPTSQTFSLQPGFTAATTRSLP